MYQLTCKTQNYAWGKKGISGKVGRLAAIQQLGLDLNSNSLTVNQKIQSMSATNYAELWMGAHPTSPSVINLPNNQGGKISLNQYIDLMPKQSLGMKVLDAQFSQLPFLFKVLSVASPLSIQIHPDKESSTVLHQQLPQIYKDSNHKPEIAIALNQLSLLYGFKGEKQFQQLIDRNRPLSGLIQSIEEIQKEQVKESQQVQQMVYQQLKVNVDELSKHSKKIKSYINYIYMNSSQDVAKSEIIQNAAEQLLISLEQRKKSNQALSQQELLALQISHTHYDPKEIIFILLMNHLTIQQGEAIFIKPGTPHAYLKGDLMQCMTSSDNVLRVGLTQKHKDIENFCKIVKTQQQSNIVLKGQNIDQTSAIQLFYPHDEKYQQFAVFKVTLHKQGQIYKLSHKFLEQSPKIIICMVGEVTVSSEENENETKSIKQGGVIFINAQLNKLQLQTQISGSQIYLASCALK